MGTITLEQMEQRLAAFEQGKDSFILEGMVNGTNFAARLAVTKYMVGGTSRDSFVDPPNSPPGPLKIRSGNLRRRMVTIKPFKKGNNFIAGLGNTAKYAAIHEFGGTTPPHFIAAKNADTLAFVGREGGLVFREVVFHPGSKIPPRPFMGPALEDATPVYEEEVGDALVRGFDRIFT